MAPFGYSAMGTWYLIELIGLVLLPCFLFLHGVRYQNLTVIRMAAVISMLGIIINRLNYSVIAFKWYVPLSQRYIPSWMEIVITLAILFTEVWVFRWIVSRMPVLRESPQCALEEKTDQKECNDQKGGPQMEGFSYVDIFATKHIEYLLVIGFLLLFIFSGDS